MGDGAQLSDINVGIDVGSFKVTQVSQQQLQDYKQAQLFCQSEFHELWV